MAQSLGHNLILGKKCFTVKNRGKLAFSSRKNAPEKRIERKTNFAYGVRYHYRRPQELRDWQQNTASPPAQEHGPGGARQTHRAFARAALETGARPDAPHLGYCFAYRHGVQCGPGVFLQPGTEADFGDRAQERSSALSRFARRR